MMTPRKIVRTLRHTAELARLLEDYSEHTARQQALLDMLEQEKIDVELGLTRVGRDLIGQFLIALDMPENHDDMRAALAAALVDFKDEVARLEERTR